MPAPDFAISTDPADRIRFAPARAVDITAIMTSSRDSTRSASLIWLLGEGGINVALVEQEMHAGVEHKCIADPAGQDGTVLGILVARRDR